MQHSLTQTEIVSLGVLLFFLLLLLLAWGRHLRTLTPTRQFLKKYRRLNKLKKMEWHTFERLCQYLFTLEGWQVRSNEKAGADGGIDLWMKKWHKEAIVQCKKYEDAKVGIHVVREIYGLMHEHNIKEAYVVTTSEFTKECYRFVEGKKIVLIDGKGVVARIKAVL